MDKYTSRKRITETLLDFYKLLYNTTCEKEKKHLKGLIENLEIAERELSTLSSKKEVSL